MLFYKYVYVISYSNYDVICKIFGNFYHITQVDRLVQSVVHSFLNYIQLFIYYKFYIYF